MRPILFTDGLIHTMESEEAVASAMLVENGRIQMLDPTPEQAKGARVVSLAGRHVYPCLIDGHVHLLYMVVLLAAGFDVCRIADGKVLPEDLEGVEREIRAFAGTKAPDEIVVGNQYIMTAIREHRLPSREELDDWCGGRAAVIYTIDGHASALSTAMLEKLGIDPRGHSGVLAGEAHERIQGRITDLIAAGVTPGILAKGIAAFHNLCADFGISCVGALDGNGDSEKDPTTKLIFFLASRFDLDVRFYLQYMDIEKAQPLRRYQSRPRIGGCGDWEMDGSIGAHSAAFSRPYRDTGSCAPTYFTQEQVDAAVRQADRRGYQIASHAIGDLAVERIVRALGKTESGRMHRIEHCEFTSDEMMEEIARRGYAVMAQPGYSWIDKRYLHTYERYLSPETLGQMRFADFLRRGICICGSSDSPVQSLDPWLQMLGMTQFYREEESVTPYEALRCYTVHPARALLEEKERGMLLAGMRADFFTSDRDLFSLSPTELGDFRPLDTWYGGKPARRWKGTPAELAGMLFRRPKKV